MPWVLTVLYCTGFYVFAQCLPPQRADMKGKVVGVSDGDTITVLTDDKTQHKVRLAHIDCPERGQPFGNKAKQFTSDFCFGQMVRVAHGGKKDRNGRYIGVVYNSRGDNLNKELVAAGLAWHFVRYSDDQSYSGLEAQARKAKRGLWVESNAIAPWVWRKRPK
jgi:endonuclease YncB( thermonuclease family)